ncbi:MAG: hypothetical protein EA397_07785 [Deltaproteobacteria bacterium]|nr:MAG: hypothetical protein EA397_07785 [Deltaproteobacteria bacterium]
MSTSRTKALGSVRAEALLEPAFRLVKAQRRRVRSSAPGSGDLQRLRLGLWELPGGFGITQMR